MDAISFRKTVQSNNFLRADLLIVAMSGAALCLFPSLGVWTLLSAIAPWGVRVVAGIAPFHRNGYDLLIALFVLSAGAGYWASYDQAIAVEKLLLILMSVLLYYALGAQLQENLVWVSAGLFIIGFGISVYFFLTHDFIASPRKVEVVNTIGRWIMDIRPSMGWQPIHPNYVAGIESITTPYVLYLGWISKKKNATRKFIPVLLVTFGVGVVLFAMLMATSRGIFMAIASTLGVLFLGLLIRSNKINFGFRLDTFFSVVVLIFLVMVVAVLYLGPAQVGDGVSGQYLFGTGSRAELFSQSIYLVVDFPFTGGGLGAFPALYSHYILGIPHYNVPNSHNLFLDIFIEQGLVGGFSFIMLYLVTLFQVSRIVIRANSFEMILFGWVAQGTLIIAFVHSMVDDYVYHENGTILLLMLFGISHSFVHSASGHDHLPAIEIHWKRPAVLIVGSLLVFLCIMNMNRIQSLWLSNIGAIQMAKVELVGFPTGAWAGPNLASKMNDAEESLLASLEADLANRTANHRLGLIALLHRDFSTAGEYLNAANDMAPNHRGVIKALGYCYLWRGDLNSAEVFLVKISEANNELDAYITYWNMQGMPGVSKYAAEMAGRLQVGSIQP